MNKSILRFLGAELEEGPKVYLLLLLGFLLGVFTATFTVVAETLFVKNLNQETELPKAFIAQGITGLLLTYLFSFYQNRMNYAKLVGFYLLGMAVVVTFLFLGLNYLSEKEPLYFIAFTLILPFGILLLLIFWGTFNRLFTLRQSKRIIGSIDTGMLIAAIIAFFSIPVFTDYLSNQYDLLIGSVISIFSLVVVFFIINRLFPLTVDHKEERMSGGRSISSLGFGEFFKKRYLQLMVLFVTVSMVAVDFLDYSFFTVADRYFLSENDMSNFLSYFNGTIVIFSFLFQTFITDKIISDYGLKVALLINPVLLTIFTAIASVAGYFIGVEKGAENIIIFFIVVAMSKLFINSLKDSLDGPSFKLYFLPIRSNIRLDIQSKVEGVVTVFSGIISGGLILLITYSESFGVLEVTFFMFPILFAWYWITTKMHNRYRLTLKETLAENTLQGNLKPRQDSLPIYDMLTKNLHQEDTREVLYSLQLIEQLEPVLFEKILAEEEWKDKGEELIGFIKNKLAQIEIDAFAIQSNGARDQVQDEIRQLAMDSIQEAKSSEILSMSTSRLNTLAKSRDTSIRILAAKLLRKIINDDNVFILMELIRDADKEVRLQAIHTARKTQRPEAWSLLIELLGSPVFSHAASSALVSLGDRVLISLESGFHKSGQSEEVMRKIVSIYGRIGSPKAIKLLWDKIEYPDKTIVSQVLEAFKQWGIRANDEYQTQILYNLLDKELSCVLWNLVSLTEIPHEEEFTMLREAMHEEIDTNFKNVYSILSFIYEPHSIQLVQDNIELGTSESIAFAIELLDVFVDPKLKPKLFPILDDIPVLDKHKQLQIVYPRERFEEDKIVQQIINRDFNYINRWTKACAIYGLSYQTEYQITDDILAHLFNPDPLIRETAAWVIYSKDRTLFQRTILRLPYEVRRQLEDVLNFSQKGFLYELRMKKILFLKTIPEFAAIPGKVLCDLVEIIEELEVLEGQEKQLNDEQYSPLYVVVYGSLRLEVQSPLILSKGQIISDPMLYFSSESATITGLEDSLLFKFNKDKFFQILTQHHEIANEYIHHVKSILNPIQVEKITQE
ncbi:HEAT repeat domain-containing protein [Cytophagales bacterium LB-30]|uniref:HEAT repeat domain-containing protein n=1 Tax=Shiella aurantiaca TaxID=3058365 RepID=A0ABT8F4L5_9BACT|nr:HEAT repeat domain-containing protein [Shiella aurantiaca]MDN4165397.1 HEAT repeat domain-containing protein [Shiella aurantiaca]